jgi:hypothetical protein
MQTGNNVYSSIFTMNLAPGVTVVQTLHLNNNNREFRVKSILWEKQFVVHASGALYPWRQNLTQGSVLTIGNAVTQQPIITKGFVNWVPAMPAGYSPGAYFYLLEPKQVYFENFYIPNELHITYTGTNNDLIETFTHQVSLVIEIEEIYQVK